MNFFNFYLNPTKISTKVKFRGNRILREKPKHFSCCTLKVCIKSQSTSIKGHSSAASFAKITGSNPILDLVSIDAYTEFGYIHSEILSGNVILTSIKGHNFVINL